MAAVFKGILSYCDAFCENKLNAAQQNKIEKKVFIRVVIRFLKSGIKVFGVLAQTELPESKYRILYRTLYPDVVSIANIGPFADDNRKIPFCDPENGKETTESEKNKVVCSPFH